MLRRHDSGSNLNTPFWFGNGSSLQLGGYLVGNACDGAVSEKASGKGMEIGVA